MPPSYQTGYGVNDYTLTVLPWALPAAARAGHTSGSAPGYPTPRPPPPTTGQLLLPGLLFHRRRVRGVDRPPGRSPGGLRRPAGQTPQQLWLGCRPGAPGWHCSPQAADIRGLP